MSEGDVDGAAQVLSGWVGDHNRHNSRGDLKGGIHTIFFMSRELVKGPVNRYLKVIVAQQRSQSKTCKRHEKTRNMIVFINKLVTYLSEEKRSLPG